MITNRVMTDEAYLTIEKMIKTNVRFYHTNDTIEDINNIIKHQPGITKSELLGLLKKKYGERYNQVDILNILSTMVLSGNIMSHNDGDETVEEFIEAKENSMTKDLASYSGVPLSYNDYNIVNRNSSINEHMSEIKKEIENGIKAHHDMMGHTRFSRLEQHHQPTGRTGEMIFMVECLDCKDK